MCIRKLTSDPLEMQYMLLCMIPRTRIRKLRISESLGLGPEPLALTKFGMRKLTPRCLNASRLEPQKPSKPW